MATLTEISAYLKTHNEIATDRLWNDVCRFDETFRRLKESGKSWRDLPISAIEKLPEHFVNYAVKKIDKGETLTDEEIEKFYNETSHVSEERGENERWTRPVTTIVEACGRYFRILWDEGLTEMNSDNFFEQPTEVTKHTYEKTIVVTVTEWNEIER